MIQYSTIRNTDPAANMRVLWDKSPVNQTSRKFNRLPMIRWSYSRKIRRILCLEQTLPWSLVSSSHWTIQLTSLSEITQLWENIASKLVLPRLTHSSIFIRTKEKELCQRMRSSWEMSKRKLIRHSSKVCQRPYPANLSTLLTFQHTTYQVTSA